MISFSPEQIQALARSRRQALIERLAIFVREHCQKSFPHGNSLLPALAAELHDAVDAQLRRAEAWGLDDEQSVASYVALAFCLSPQFDLQPSIRLILANEVLPAAQRMEHVYQYLGRAEAKYLDQKFSGAGTAW